MKKQWLNTTIVAIIIVSINAIAGDRTPSNQNDGTACDCKKATGSQSCAYSKSSQNSLCNCGSVCCNDSGNEVDVTITPWNGGSCDAASAGCGNATEGTSSSGKGKIKDGGCAG